MCVSLDPVLLGPSVAITEMFFGQCEPVDTKECHPYVAVRAHAASEVHKTTRPLTHESEN